MKRNILKNNNLLSFVTLLTTLLLFSSCFKDTCNNKIGVTFYNIVSNNVSQNLSGNIEIKFTTSTNKNLPSKYFIDCSYSSYNNINKHLDSIYCTYNTIYLLISDSIHLLQNNSLNLDCQIIFNDKRQYTNCRHMGKNDIYFLDLSFIIKRIDSINYQILDFTWKETVHMGAI